MDREILGMLAEVLLDERLDDIMKLDQRYRELQKQINEQGDKFEGLEMDKEQFAVAEKLISMHITSIGFYVKNAYKQGFKDCLSLLLEIGLIKSGDVFPLQNKMTDTYGVKE